MDNYDSDSSDEAGHYTETGILLGYASKEPTDDTISHLGGHPTWLDPQFPPPESFAKCKVCNDLMSLVLELNGDLPEHFPDDERRLYVLTCTRKTCTRKNGSVRAFRGVKKNGSQRQNKKAEEKAKEQPKERERLGESIFGVKSSGPTASMSANPFSTSSTTKSSQDSNPFAPLPPVGTLGAKPPQEPSPATQPSSALLDFSSLAAKPPQQPFNSPTDSLPETFASKARLSSPDSTSTPETLEPWPRESFFQIPYPLYHLDADYETLSAPSTPLNVPRTTRFDDEDSGSATIKDSFESSLDKSFLRFSDRLAQNPEQVLRYEFKGKPLLYSTTDEIGRRLVPRQQGSVRSHLGIPGCPNCGAERVFEVQLVPHAITVLEEELRGVLGEGMEWGTVIVGVCARDCAQKGKESKGEVGYIEEWVGVQWEERVQGK